MQSFWPWLSLASGRTSPTLMPQSTLVAWVLVETKAQNHQIHSWVALQVPAKGQAGVSGWRNPQKLIPQSCHLPFWKWETGVSSPLKNRFQPFSIFLSYLVLLCPKWSQPHARVHRSFWSLFVNHFLHDLKTENAKSLAWWYQWCRSSRTCTLG